MLGKTVGHTFNKGVTDHVMEVMRREFPVFHDMLTMEVDENGAYTARFSVGSDCHIHDSIEISGIIRGIVWSYLTLHDQKRLK